MTTSEIRLLDTNILVYAADCDSPLHDRCVRLRDSCLAGDIVSCISPQVLGEFFAVITHPRRVANPLPQEEARSEVEKYYRCKGIRKIYHGPAAVEIMLDLLKRYKSTQQDIFDLRLWRPCWQTG